MKTEMALVKSGGSILDTVKVEVFDTVEEAGEHLGEDVILRMINAQHKAEVTNKIRAEKTKVTPAERELLKKIRAGQATVS